jgi:hypothetical protein
MKIPYMDPTTGKVRFPDDKHVSKEEFEAYFAPKTEDNNVGDHGHTTDHHDPDSDLEAEQTSDMRELGRLLETRVLWSDLLAGFRNRGIPESIWVGEIENCLNAAKERINGND